MALLTLEELRGSPIVNEHELHSTKSLKAAYPANRDWRAFTVSPTWPDERLAAA